MKNKLSYKNLLISVLSGIILFSLNQFTFAQTSVAISDTAFVNVLKKNIPQVIDANDKLIVAQAKAYTGTLYIKNSNIQNIDEIKYFESVTNLTVTETQLTVFPSIANLKNLQILTCNTNKLTRFPDFSKNTKIQQIQCKNNQITSLPVIANLDSLKIIDFTYNKVDTIPLFSNLPSLKSIVGYNNNIRYISPFNNVPNLQTLILENNAINSLENIYSIKSLTFLNVMNNKLPFSELNKLKTHPAFSDFLIFPQDTIDEVKYMQFFTLNPKALRMNNVPNPIDFDFDWYKNGGYLKTINGIDSFYFTNLLQSDTGKYTCVVKCTNPASPYFGKSLTYNTMHLSFGVCKNFNTITYQIINKKCTTGTDISIDENFNLGAYGPFIYTLKNDKTLATINSNSAKITNLQAGVYSVTIQDIDKNCIVQIPSIIKIDSIPNCVIKNIIGINNNYFSPDGDGQDETYLIENIGNVEIFNRQGELVKHLKIPANWDGTDDNGKLLDLGYYAIIINGKTKLFVTLLN